MNWLKTVYREWGFWAALAAAALFLLAWYLGFDVRNWM